MVGTTKQTTLIRPRTPVWLPNMVGAVERTAQTRPRTPPTPVSPRTPPIIARLHIPTPMARLRMHGGHYVPYRWYRWRAQAVPPRARRAHKRYGTMLVTPTKSCQLHPLY